MTTQEKKAYLRQYRAIKNEVDSLKCEIEEIKDLRRSLSGIDYGKDRVQSTPSDNLINSICTQEKLDFWAKEGYKIYEFKDKYIVKNERKEENADYH